MSKILIENFGPIRNHNSVWIDFNKVTLFIGEQGSGKSSAAKLISTFNWIEKALVRGEIKKEDIKSENFIKKNLSYHRLENYINKNTKIKFIGNAYDLSFDFNNKFDINFKNLQNYFYPQILYIPSERNFISYVRKPRELALSSQSLLDFVTEYINALDSLNEVLFLPDKNTFLVFDKKNDTVYLNSENYNLKLSEASSGFQSLVPLFIVSNHISNIIANKDVEPMSVLGINRFMKEIDIILNDKNLTEEQKKIALSLISKKYSKSAFINIVEEPEQNLYPLTQKNILYSLLKFNNSTATNKLLITTHSPYFINYLSLAAKAFKVFELMRVNPKHKNNDINLFLELCRIVNQESAVDGSYISIYSFDGNGEINKIENVDNIPSDENILNKTLEAINDEYSVLLEIESKLCS